MTRWLKRSLPGLVPGLLLVVTMGGCESAERDRLRIGPYSLSVPEYNLQSNRASGFPLTWTVDYQNGVSATLQFENRYFAERLKGFSPPRSRLGTLIETERLIVAYPTERDRRQTRERAYKYADLWLGSGAFAERRVEPFEGTTLFRVYESGDPRSGWRVVSRDPRVAADAYRGENFWIASCYTMSFGKKTCRLSMILERTGLYLEFSLEEVNVPLYAEMARLLEDNLIEWGASCERPTSSCSGR